MFGVWIGGIILGLVAGGVALTEVPLWVKFAVAGGVIMVGVLGRIGAIVLGGLLFSAGVLTFAVLLLTGAPSAVSPSVGVALLLAAGGAALSIRTLFRERQRDSPAGPHAIPQRDEGV